MRTLVLFAAIALLGAGDATPVPAASGSPTDGQYFLGTWKCGSVTWTFAPLYDGSPWIRDTYGDPQKPGGTAILGYVAQLAKWIYRDFHTDGSYADLTSGGPVDGRWEWTGPYYPAGSSAVFNGRITYAIVSPTRYDRTFETLENGVLVKHGGDTCSKS